MYIHMYVYIYMYMCVYIYIYVYVFGPFGISGSWSLEPLPLAQALQSGLGPGASGAPPCEARGSPAASRTSAENIV